MYFFIFASCEPLKYVFYHLHVISNLFSDIFPRKILHSLQSVKSKTIGIGKRAISQNHTTRETAYGLIHKYDHNLKKKEEYEFDDFGINLKLKKCAPYNDTKNSFYPKCHLFPVLWECLTFVMLCVAQKNL